MNDQPEPRTDKEMLKAEDLSDFQWGDKGWSFANKLERELAQLERERDELAESILNLSHPNCQILLRERDEARNEIIGWRNKWDCAIDMAARAENALDEMTLRWEQTNDALFQAREQWRMSGVCRQLDRELHEAREACVVAVDQLVVAQSENRKERALADRLAKLLELYHHERDWPSVEALAVWKEARK